MDVELQNVWAYVRSASDAEHAWLDEYLSWPDDKAWVMKRRGYRVPAATRLYARGKYPAGFTRLVRTAAQLAGHQVNVVDARVRPPGASLPVPSYLRPYQADAVRQVVKRTRGVVWAATGSGKTQVAMGLVESTPARWLFLVNLTQLGLQARDRYRAFCGLEAGVIAEGAWEPDLSAHGLTVATFQSLWARLRKDAADQDRREAVKFLAGVEGVIVDECFLAGTIVGGRPIETLKPGDTIPSYDQATGQLCAGTVRRLTVREAENLVRVVFSDGRSTVCTPGHPFMTAMGWVPASQLAGKDVLRCADDMSYLQQTVHAEQATDLRPAAPQHSTGMFTDVQKAPRTDVSGTSRDACSAHASAQPHVQGCGQSQDGCNQNDAGKLATPCARREWQGTDGASAVALRPPRIWVGDGACGHHRVPASPLQIGPSTTDVDDRSGSGWQLSQSASSQGAGSKEGSMLTWARVARVEVLQPRGSEEHRRVCPDGLVYNLHVDRTETYIVDGSIVHNCHVLPADTFRAALDHMDSAYYRVGLSATPLVRGDKRSMHLIGCLGSVVYRIGARTLIEAGVLARPVIRFVRHHGVSQRATWQGAYSELVAKSAKRNQLVADLAAKAVKPCVVFVKQLDQGRDVTRRLSKLGVRTEYVDGSTPTPVRQVIVTRLERGDTDVVVATVVMNQGIDIPNLASVVMAASGASPVEALQRVGRGMRRVPGKEVVDVWDVLDEGNKFTERWTKERMRAYEVEEYEYEVLP